MDEVILLLLVVLLFFLFAATTWVLLDCLKLVTFRVYEFDDSAFP